MKVADLLGAMADAAAGSRREDWCQRRYAFLFFDPERASTDYAPNDPEPDGAHAEMVPIGDADSLYGTLDRVAQFVAEQFEPATPDDPTVDLRPAGVAEDEFERWLDPSLLGCVPHLRAIQSPVQRIGAYYLMGVLSGPMDVVETPWHDYYQHRALAWFPGAKYLCGQSAAPPHHEEAWCLIEVQPTGMLSEPDRALVRACAAGDATDVRAALAAGARPNALDARGIGPLHVAVAHRQPAAVAALLEAGASPDLQAAYGNAPLFADVTGERIGPYARLVADDAHGATLRRLVDAGADVNARNRAGATLVDLLLAAPTYPAAWLRDLAARGATSGRLEHATLTTLLSSLPLGQPEALQQLVHQVRFLLERGADPNAAPSDGLGHPPLGTLIGSKGYYANEVSGEILAALVDLLLAHGARDGNDVALFGRSALETAETRVQHGFDHYAGVVERLRRARRA